MERSCMKRTFLVSFCALAFATCASAVGIGPVDWSQSERVSDGIEMVGLSYDTPRLMKAKAMRVDMSNTNLFFVANGRADRWGRPIPGHTNYVAGTRRMTVEEFMMNARAPVGLGGRGLDMVVAFNTSPWSPFIDPIPVEYAYISGHNISEGVAVTCGSDKPKMSAYFVIGRDGKADIVPAPMPESVRAGAWIAQVGFDIVLKDGKALYKPEEGPLHPRTVLGLSQDRRWLYVLALEGRHPGISLGANYFDLAQIMLSLGATDAINMDGGGSTTLLRWDDAAGRQAVCLQQDTPARRVALSIGICRRRAAAEPSGAEAAFEAAMDGDMERCAGIYYRYEPGDERDTPPPDGYRPFYVSHFGRHGCRYQISETNLFACPALERAEAAGVLTPAGRELLRRARIVSAAHDGMFGALSIRGAEEHRGIARRMHDRLPGVFADGGLVRCQATTRHRCLLSMANFTCELKGIAPKLNFEYVTGDKYTTLLNYHDTPSEDRKEAMKKAVDSALYANVRPERMLKLLFTNREKACEAIGDPSRFMSNLFYLALACPSLDHELDGLSIFDFFTRGERIALAKYINARHYSSMGNSTEFGDGVLARAKGLAEDFARRADEAIRGGRVRADLRFGHDVGLWPLVGLIGVEGAGARCPVAESWAGCPLWKNMPMATNIQIVFYRNGGGDVLVKVLYNEREAALVGLAPVKGPYYRWQDVRSRLCR